MINKDLCVDLTYDKMLKAFEAIPKRVSIFFFRFAPQDTVLKFITKRHDCLLCHDSLRQKIKDFERYEINRYEFGKFIEKWSEEWGHNKKLTSVLK